MAAADRQRMESTVSENSDRDSSGLHKLIDQPAGLAGEREEPRLRTYDSFELTVISIEGDKNVTKSARCARWAIYRHV